jgi:hypothetical protein
MSALKVTSLLDNQTVDETAGAATPLNGSKNFAVPVRWGAGTSSGVVVIEQATHKDYTGTWSNLTTFTWAAADSVDVWRGTGPFGAIRARIATAITTTDKGVYADLWEN